MSESFNRFICSERIGKSTVHRPTQIDEFYSDRSRVLYCSSFRRLQQKAQVFSLEPNSSVRTRLTHSLEVSDIGRTLANSIAYELCSRHLLSPDNIHIVVSIVENACLLHDIGNPPFGHFGEAAIKDWAQDYVKRHKCNPADISTLNSLMEDFLQFDGNPQGFRTVTRLHSERDDKGLNLTYSTLLCILKYSRAAGEEGEKPLPIPVKLPSIDSIDELNGFNLDISIPWSKAASKEAVNNFMSHIEEVSAGTAGSLISKNGEIGRVLATVKRVSRKYLYTSIKAESIELTGFSVITGILKRYERLLQLPAEEFRKIVNHEQIDGRDYERRLFNRLGTRYVKAYQYALENVDMNNEHYSVYELWLRIHLIIDHISGMTDEFALETYQMLEGIQLLKT